MDVFILIKTSTTTLLISSIICNKVHIISSNIYLNAIISYWKILYIHRLYLYLSVGLGTCHILWYLLPNTVPNHWVRKGSFVWITFIFYCFLSRQSDKCKFVFSPRIKSNQKHFIYRFNSNLKHHDTFLR